VKPSPGDTVKIVRGGSDWGWQAYGIVTDVDTTDNKYRVEYHNGQLMTNPGEHEWFSFDEPEQVDDSYFRCEIVTFGD
jgi:hypothetical protein